MKNDRSSTVFIIVCIITTVFIVSVMFVSTYFYERSLDNGNDLAMYVGSNETDYQTHVPEWYGLNSNSYCYKTNKNTPDSNAVLEIYLPQWFTFANLVKNEKCVLYYESRLSYWYSTTLYAPYTKPSTTYSAGSLTGHNVYIGTDKQLDGSPTRHYVCGLMGSPEFCLRQEYWIYGNTWDHTLGTAFTSNEQSNIKDSLCSNIWNSTDIQDPCDSFCTATGNSVYCTYNSVSCGVTKDGELFCRYGSGGTGNYCSVYFDDTMNFNYGAQCS